MTDRNTHTDVERVTPDGEEVGRVYTVFAGGRAWIKILFNTYPVLNFFLSPFFLNVDSCVRTKRKD